MARLKTLIIAVPKGSLGEATLRVFSKLGLIYNLESQKSQFEFRWKGYEIVIKIMRAQSIPRTILAGAAHIGITGEDCIREDKLERIAKNGKGKKRDVVILKSLNYNKQSSGYIRVVSVRRKDDRKKYSPESKIKIVSEFPYITREYYANAEIQPVIGGAEDEFAAHDEFDICVCVTETGRGLEKKNLLIENELFKSTTVLIVKKVKPELELFARRIEGVINAPDYRNIKFHINVEKWKKVEKDIPALFKPNVYFITGTDICSVETIVKEDEVQWLIEKMTAMGASGFVEAQPISVMP